MGRRLLASCALAALLATAGCAGGPFSGGAGTTGKPPSGRHLRGADRGVSFRYDIGTLTVELKQASKALRRRIRGQLTARCGKLRASETWPGGTAKLSFELHPKPAPGNSISPDPRTLNRFRSCELVPIPSTHPIVSATMHPASRG
jgi:hypothetical protein